MEELNDNDDFKDAVKLRSLSTSKKKELSNDEKNFIFGTESSNEEENEKVIKPHKIIASPFPPRPQITEEEITTARKESINSDDEIIIIKDQKRRVELSYSHEIAEGKFKTFSVGVPAASIEVQKDGVSILISKDIEIRPPTLTPCKLKTNNKEYTVIFAGATHTIGRYINIPFIIVEE